jgi:membrane associated rhomboid family serine protease
MGYEDRDYFRAKPSFGLSAATGPATKALIIAVVSGYLIGLLVGNTTAFNDPGFWDAAGQPGTQQAAARAIFVLTASDIAPWAAGYSPGYWKLLTGWLVAPTLIGAVIDALLVYFAGRYVEEILGWKRFVSLFIAACVAAGLLAGIVDPLLMGSREQIVIMGSSPGIFACFVSMIWIAPEQRSIFGWPLKKVVLILLAVVVLLNFLFPLLGGAQFALSPTYLMWGIAAGALYMSYLKSINRLPAQAPARPEAQWGEAGLMVVDDDPASAKERERQRRDAERIQREEQKRLEEEQARREQLDAILDKISREGIDRLSRAERKFLDSQSKRSKDQR